MSLRWLLDTNVVSAPFRPHPPPRLMEALASRQGACGISAVTWHELVFGHALLPDSAPRAALGRYLREVVLPSFPVLPYGRGAAEWHAAERARLRSLGREPPFADGQIAATAAANGLVLVTTNLSDFAGFEGLTVEDWRA